MYRRTVVITRYKALYSSSWTLSAQLAQTGTASPGWSSLELCYALYANRTRSRRVGE